MILVTGTGRSGTSVVARLLHEELGVSMGSEFAPPSRPNPEGEYEDLEVRELHVRFTRGEMTLPEFRAEAETILALRDEPWGFKDPRASHVLGLWLQWCEPTVVLRERPLDDVVRSTHRHYHTELGEARRETVDRREQLRRVLRGYPDVHRIDMSERRDEGELVEELREVVG